MTEDEIPIRAGSENRWPIEISEGRKYKVRLPFKTFDGQDVEIAVAKGLGHDHLVFIVQGIPASYVHINNNDLRNGTLTLNNYSTREEEPEEW